MSTYQFHAFCLRGMLNTHTLRLLQCSKKVYICYLSSVKNTCFCFSYTCIAMIPLNVFLSYYRTNTSKIFLVKSTSLAYVTLTYEYRQHVRNTMPNVQKHVIRQHTVTDLSLLISSAFTSKYPIRYILVMGTSIRPYFS